MFRRLSVRTKLLLVIVTALVAVIAVALVAVSTISAVSVDGTAATKRAQIAALAAAVEPPQQRLVEAQLLVNELVAAKSVADAEPLILKLDKLRDAYYQAHLELQADLEAHPVASGTKLASLVADESYAPAVLYWDAYRSELVPLAMAGDFDAAKEVLEKKLQPNYDKHIAALDAARKLIGPAQDKIEADATHQLNVREKVLWGVTGLGILMVALVGYVMTQAIRRPVQQLINAANTVANQELPDVVREIERGSDSDGLPVLMPISVSSSDEINDLAEAFDSVRHTAVELAGAQAATRRAAAHMFINLGRRNQALVDRQIAYIDALERSQTDPDVLQSLFRLDHLATRMRRQAESLLVLAGADQPGRWAERVSVYDVIRAALSEVEEYDKVHIADVEDATVAGNLAADLTHMLAELIENATNFSPPTEPVEVRAISTGDSLEISVRDRGIGMDRQMVDLANQRISGSRTFSVTAASSLGLFVVGRLARRHSIDARLEPVDPGMVARVSIPATAVTWNDPEGRYGGSDAERSRAEAIDGSAVREGFDQVDTDVELPAVSATDRFVPVIAGPTPATTLSSEPVTDPLDHLEPLDRQEPLDQPEPLNHLEFEGSASDDVTAQDVAAHAALLEQYAAGRSEVAAAILPARGPLAPVDPRTLSVNPADHRAAGVADTASGAAAVVGAGAVAASTSGAVAPLNDAVGDDTAVDPDATPPRGLPVFESFPEISSDAELRTADDVRAMFEGLGQTASGVNSNAGDRR